MFPTVTFASFISALLVTYIVATFPTVIFASGISALFIEIVSVVIDVE